MRLAPPLMVGTRRVVDRTIALSSPIEFSAGAPGNRRSTHPKVGLLWSLDSSDGWVASLITVWLRLGAHSMRALFSSSFDSRYAEPDRVPCLPDRSALPARRVQRLLRGLPGHHHRAATRYVLDIWFPFPTACSSGTGTRQ
jgi:hypothetical protein